MTRRRGKDSGKRPSRTKRSSSGTQLEQAPDQVAHSRARRGQKSKKEKRTELGADEPAATGAIGEPGNKRRPLDQPLE